MVELPRRWRGGTINVTVVLEAGTNAGNKEGEKAANGTYVASRLPVRLLEQRLPW